MNNDVQKQRIIDLLRNALTQHGESVDEETLLDDPNFLARWEENRISAQEREALIQQLISNPQMRKQLAEMLEDGVLQLPAVESDLQDEIPGSLEGWLQHDSSPTKPAQALEQTDANTNVVEKPPTNLPASSTGKWTAIVGGVMALAAMFALAFVLWPGYDFESTYQTAKKHLDNGKFEQAYPLLLDAAEHQPTGTQARDILEGLELAAYEVAKKQLTAADFDSVGATCQQVHDVNVDSDRLRNLNIQSLRKMDTEVAIADKPMVVDYDFEDRSQRDDLATMYETAIRDFPGSELLHLNYGQFLIEEFQFEEARSQFAMASSPEWSSRQALGLGIAAYGEGVTSKSAPQERFQEASRLFQNAEQEGGDLVAALVNEALTQSKLGNLVVARQRLERAKQLADPIRLERLKTLQLEPM